MSGGTVLGPEKRAALEARLARVAPDRAPAWGRMNANQMICHLADTLRYALGEVPEETGRFPLPPFAVRWVALHTPLPWPKGSPTLPAFDQEQTGTPTTDFESDRMMLKALLDRFDQAGESWPRHPIMGRMSTSEWGRWAQRHMDHHLRQFGV